jgi:hypothetical protein
VTLDGRPVAVSEVETGLLTIDLPQDNVLGVPAQRAFSVAHGWVALLHPGHVITIHIVGTDPFGNSLDTTNRTTIIVQPRGKARPLRGG